MKFSQKIQSCNLSPIRQFYPYEVAAQNQGIKVLHLNIGQPDVETPRAFYDAVRAYGNPVIAYGPTPGIEVYLDAVREYYATLGAEIQRGDILATFGGSEALQIAMTCITDPGDEILTPEPFYSNYATFTKVAGGVIVPIPTSPENGYHFATREQIEPLITKKTKAILFTNPGNPTGTVLSASERQLIADIAREHNLFILADEVYRELIYNGKRPATMLTFPDLEDHVIVVDSISKRFSSCGARVGALISRNHELIGHALKICQSRLCAATLDQIGAAAMYQTLDEDYYTMIRADYRKRRDAIVTALRKIPGVKFTVPEGAFYIMVTLPVDDTEKLQYFLLKEFSDHGETVMYAPGNGFYSGDKGKNEIRVAYVTNPEELTRAIELLGMGIAAYQNKNQ